MEHIELNLARKWRSKNFQEVIGQSLAVRILQNSLYLKQFFPVYLFSGQRGCGKTSTARIFAAAVNCSRLSEFQIDPRKVMVPCLACESCMAMNKSQHPDFIEIDAASHTGVDNVRNIIESSSFLPLLSHKKIYLIDEAHMLSKAAFNAFLKILEEPPTSVIFILATTDIQKILETVKSRCFQVFFDPVSNDIIQSHLEKLCIAENINYDEEGLLIIAQQAGGSVRDAINLLEQVRFATKKITKASVLSILGHIDEVTLLGLFEKIIQGNPADLLLFCSKLEKYELSVEYIWQQLRELVYDVILMNYEVNPRHFHVLMKDYYYLVHQGNMQALISLFEMLCSHEQHLAQTTKKIRYLEMMLLLYIAQSSDYTTKKKNKELSIDADIKKNCIDYHAKWKQFVERIKMNDDVVLVTMFTESDYIDFQEDKKVIKVSFLKKFELFQDRLEQDKSMWYQHFQLVFGQDIEYNFLFDRIVEKNITHQYEHKSIPKPEHQSSVVNRSMNDSLDISDQNKWQRAHQLLHHFGGTISEISGKIYE